MLTPLSILSLHQGDLNARRLTEDEYYARFATPEPVRKPRRWLTTFNLAGLIVPRPLSVE